jgi:hypothetical protein
VKEEGPSNFGVGYYSFWRCRDEGRCRVSKLRQFGRCSANQTKDPADVAEGENPKGWMTNSKVRSGF